MGKSFFLILISVAFAATGQIILKLGMNKVGQISVGSYSQLSEAIIKMLTTPLVPLGLLFYVLAASLWLVVLSRVPLSLAYPMVALGYVIVVFLSWFVLKEVVPPTRWLGLAVICLGVILVGKS